MRLKREKIISYFCIEFFKECIVDPEVDVASPKAFVLCRGNVRNSSLINLKKRKNKSQMKEEDENDKTK